MSMPCALGPMTGIRNKTSARPCRRPATLVLPGALRLAVRGAVLPRVARNVEKPHAAAHSMCTRCHSRREAARGTRARERASALLLRSPRQDKCHISCLSPSAAFPRLLQRRRRGKSRQINRGRRQAAGVGTSPIPCISPYILLRVWAQRFLYKYAYLYKINYRSAMADS